MKLNVPLTPESIEEFKKIIKEEYEIELTDEDALDQATKTIQLALLLQEKVMGDFFKNDEDKED